MTDFSKPSHEELAAALSPWVRQLRWPLDVVVAAANERLAQLSETCGTCGGKGIYDWSDYREPGPCPSCHGRGTVYPPALVERIASVMHKAIRIPNMGDSRRGEWIELSWSGYEDQFIAAAVAVLDALNTEPA